MRILHVLPAPASTLLHANYKIGMRNWVVSCCVSIDHSSGGFMLALNDVLVRG